MGVVVMVVVVVVVLDKKKATTHHINTTTTTKTTNMQKKNNKKNLTNDNCHPYNIHHHIDVPPSPLIPYHQPNHHYNPTNTTTTMKQHTLNYSTPKTIK